MFGKMLKIVGVMGAMAWLGGCAELWTPLPRAQRVDRAAIPEEALPVPKEEARVSSPGMAIAPPAPVEKGVYEFQVPETVTQAQRQTDKYEQYLLYWGKPAAGDRPFVVITVGPVVQAESEKEGGQLKAEASRTYRLNGLVAKEWTGYTADKRPFCELIVTRLGAGDQLHALAVAKTAEQREAALQVLSSIEWKVMK